jgi:acyl-CoA dehydrogenase
MTTLLFFALLSLGFFLLYHGKALLAWTLPLAIGLCWWKLKGEPSALNFWLVTAPLAVIGIIAVVPALRRMLITKHVMRLMAPMFPAMSDTERVALEAGTVWWDAELFSGAPNWKKLIEHKSPGLSDKEKSFLANEVNEVCRMVDNEVIDETGDLDDATWQYLKDKGFMGIIIPESYGGLGFSAEANSAIVAKVSSRSVTLAVTVMVPNSLGPAELLLHYGTEEQKNHYLPLLANGREVPAFALTEPGAGSDASSMSASGVVCKGHWEGEEVTGIRLNWD